VDDPTARVRIIYGRGEKINTDKTWKLSQLSH
jgi:hypothetical protein